jgi:hypothetical protein
LSIAEQTNVWFGGYTLFVRRWVSTNSTFFWMKWFIGGMKMSERSWSRKIGIHVTYNSSLLDVTTKLMDDKFCIRLWPLSKVYWLCHASSPCHVGDTSLEIWICILHTSIQPFIITII